eukprot:2624732-Rhodomonas_salina.2
MSGPDLVSAAAGARKFLLNFWHEEAGMFRGPTFLRICYAMSGTDLAYGATSAKGGSAAYPLDRARNGTIPDIVSSYVRAMQCPLRTHDLVILMSRMVASAYAICGTVAAYGATRVPCDPATSSVWYCSTTCATRVLHQLTCYLPTRSPVLTCCTVLPGDSRAARESAQA